MESDNYIIIASLKSEHDQVCVFFYFKFYQTQLRERTLNRLVSLATQQAFSEHCLINFISKDTRHAHLVFTIFEYIFTFISLIFQKQGV